MNKVNGDRPVYGHLDRWLSLDGDRMINSINYFKTDPELLGFKWISLIDSGFHQVPTSAVSTLRSHESELVINSSCIEQILPFTE